MERLTEWTGERWIAVQKRLNGKIVGDKDLYKRLAEYEDTGLEPDEVLKFKKDNEILRDSNKNLCNEIDRISRHFHADSFGKTVFLTREEAVDNLIFKSVLEFQENNNRKLPSKIYISYKIYRMYADLNKKISVDYKEKPKTLYGIPFEVDSKLSKDGFYFKEAERALEDMKND